MNHTNIGQNSRRNLEKAASCGEPSYIWRAGQERRLNMIREAAENRLQGVILENGCGVGMYAKRLSNISGRVIGLEFDLDRAQQASNNLKGQNSDIINAASEGLPFAEASFDLILSHEVLEHVQDDQFAVKEMVRTLRPGGRIAIFVPNRGYPFETHGIYWRNKYRFGNIPFINYLPRRVRDRLAPHVRIYSSSDLEKLFFGLPVQIIQRHIIFGAYDNLIYRFGSLAKILRHMLQALESTPLRILGLSHFWIIEKLA